MRRPLVILLLVALTPGCDWLFRREATATHSPLIKAGAWGRFLESTPKLEASNGEPLHILRTTGVDGGELTYERIKARVGAPRPGFVHMTMRSVAPGVGTSFRYRCAKQPPTRVRGWVFTRGGHNGPRRLTLAYGRRSIVVPIPGDGHRLIQWQAPLSSALCDMEGGPALTVRAIDAPADTANETPGPENFLISPPQLLGPASAAKGPVVLISVDTLRIDFWDGRTGRPSALQRLADDSRRFEQAFSSFPTTPESHSVMLSGLFPNTLPKKRFDDSLTLAAGLRDAGYATLGFVSGGYMRAGFGFGGRTPGFARGFDLWLEEMRTQPQQRLDRARKAKSALIAERAIESHTLGPALERSLRWFRDHPGEPALHVLHGYDVHDYRSVVRRWWDRTLATYAERGGDLEEVKACGKRIRLKQDEQYVVHFAMSAAFRGRVSGKLGELEPCHRLMTELLYEARVRSSEAMLARYVEGLVELGLYDDALIILTSDHGESLLDEAGWDGTMQWGHNRILDNNMRVPLWIKLPNDSEPGARQEQAGLVDIRATLADAMKLDLGTGEGKSLLATSERSELIQMSSSGDGYGLVLPTGALCHWQKSGDGVRMFRDGAWRQDADARTVCAAARAGSQGELDTVELPSVPPELRDELRALGYVE